ncbi:MAG: DUF177 domain-containing protein [Armatimonadetes bacterium]|nr:DUF177 domain-containing protein [Armatimonadota bacterium]
MKKRKLLDLNEAVQHPGKHITFDVSTKLEEVEDLDLVEPLTGTLDAVSTGNVLLLSGSFQTRAVQECSRCLSPVEASIKFDVAEEFPIGGTPGGYGSGHYAEVSADEPSSMFEDNSLLFEELLRQVLWLNLPVRPLCGEQCPGLTARAETTDEGRPEFAALAELLDNREGCGK